MTVQNQNNKHIYDGDGARYLWPYTFSLGEDPVDNPLSGHKEWIQVILVDPAGTETPLTSDFYVDLANHQVIYPGYESGTEPAPELQPPKLPAGWKIVLLRDVPLTQEMDLVTQGPYLAEDLERALDKITYIAQQLAEKLSRVLIGPISSVISYALPAPLANALLGWSSDGTRIENKTGIPSLFGASEIQAAIDHVTDTTAAHLSSAIQHGAGTVETALQTLQTDKLDTTAQAADTAKVAGKTVNLTGIQDGQVMKYEAATDTFVVGDAGAGAPGLTGYIASGRKFTPGADLNLPISAGVDSITEQKVVRSENTVELYARRAQLIYDTKTGTTEIIDAAFPAADAGTVCRWIIDGSATIASTVGSNDLTRNGTVTQVNGWASDYAGQGNGSTGYYASANSTGFPTGANVREIFLVITINYINTSTAAYFASYGTSSASNYEFSIGCRTDGKLGIAFSNATFSDTGYALEVGKTYCINAAYDGVYANVYVNGALVYRASVTPNTQANSLSLFKWAGSTSNFSQDIIHYVELRSALRTSAEIAAISNVLLLPCRYYTSETTNTYTDIRAILPADAIALGFARTDAVTVISSDDGSYKYGRREGAWGGNRRVFLGWQYFSGATKKLWDNPFGTEKIEITGKYKSSLASTTVYDLTYTDAYDNTGWLRGATPTRIMLYCQHGSYIQTTCGENLSGTWGGTTSGYMGCYAEVME